LKKIPPQDDFRLFFVSKLYEKEISRGPVLGPLRWKRELLGS